MKQAGSKGESLLPSAGEFTGELVFAFSQPELFQTFAHGLPPIFYVIHARDEIEILLNAQIFPKAESLRHVTDLALDYFTLVDDVMAKNGAAPVICAK